MNSIGVAEANATVSGYLSAAAKAGNIAAIIFVKTRANWRERRSPDGIPAIGTEANSNVVLVLPDNGRDPERRRCCKALENTTLESESASQRDSSKSRSSPRSGSEGTCAD
jgi:hypothetical protein